MQKTGSAGRKEETFVTNAMTLHAAASNLPSEQVMQRKRRRLRVLHQRGAPSELEEVTSAPLYPAY